MFYLFIREFEFQVMFQVPTPARMHWKDINLVFYRPVSGEMCYG
jgi:hypothetical protein